jgi:hypothetical protein
MSWVDWPCGTTTIYGSEPFGRIEPNEAQKNDHAVDCVACRSV